jgi:hypothetical protein
MTEDRTKTFVAVVLGLGVSSGDNTLDVSQHRQCYGSEREMSMTTLTDGTSRTGLLQLLWLLQP